MDASLRNTPGLIRKLSFNTVPRLSLICRLTEKIERLRDDLIKHFEAIIGHAGVR